MPIQPDKNKRIYILSMILVNIDTSEEQLLFEKKGSKCHFANEIRTEDYIIYLRVDWSDIKNTDPVLDADIYRNILGKRGNNPIKTKSSWHHTEKTYDLASDSMIYNFNFENLQLRLRSKISVAMSWHGCNFSQKMIMA
jgi:hypothetical protein